VGVAREKGRRRHRLREYGLVLTCSFFILLDVKKIKKSVSEEFPQEKQASFLSDLFLLLFNFFIRRHIITVVLYS
jgi:hypothetical protein